MKPSIPTLIIVFFILALVGLAIWNAFTQEIEQKHIDEAMKAASKVIEIDSE